VTCTVHPNAAHTKMAARVALQLVPSKDRQLLLCCIFSPVHVNVG
jgi:hypothetical protein